MTDGRALGRPAAVRLCHGPTVVQARRVNGTRVRVGGRRHRRRHRTALDITRNFAFALFPHTDIIITVGGGLAGMRNRISIRLTSSSLSRLVTDDNYYLVLFLTIFLWSFIVLRFARAT